MTDELEFQESQESQEFIQPIEPELDDLASLTGFEPEPNPTDNPIEQSELFEPIQDPHESKTKPTLSSSPYAKAGLVGVALMIVFGIGGFFAAQLAGVDIKKAPSLVKEKPPETTQLVKKAEASEVGELKTQLAIASQERQLKAVEESKKPRVNVKPATKPESEPPRPTPKSTPSPPPSPPPPSPPRKTVYTPPPKRVTPPPPPPPMVNTERSRGVKPLPKPLPEPPPTRAVPEPPSELPPEPDPETKPESETDWQTLAAIGSYGSGSTISSTPSTRIAQADVSAKSGITFQTGQMASAEIVTPIICIPDQRFIAELTEPMTSRNGWELLPTGTQITMTCESVEENGMVALNAIAISNNEAEYPIKEGAISIRGEGGQPLIAESYNNHRGEIAKRDRTLFITGALSRVGEILNEPESESSVTTNSGSSQTSSTVTSSSPDILGAILEGGFEPLTEQIAARNEQRLEALTSQETIWYLPAKSQIQIFINQSFSL